jgi:hypothetical protein
MVCAATLVLWTGSRRDRVHALLHRVPGLSATMADHLVLDDDRSFARYAESAGTAELRNTLTVFWRTIESNSTEAYVRTSAATTPYQRRIATALAEQFACPDYLRELNFRARLTPKQGLTLRRLVEEEAFLRSRPNVPAMERLQGFERVLTGFQSFGYVHGILLTEEDIANETVRLGHPDQQLVHLRRALAAANSAGGTFMKCQLLGVLGAVYHRIGEPDSMRACYDEALQIARRCRFPDQFARILLFQANYQADQGHLVAATDMVDQAQRQCREMGGGGLELRFVVGAMNHFADLGCWEIVERLLERCPALVRELTSSADRHLFEDLRLRVERRRIDVLIHRGYADRAIVLLNRIEKPYRINVARPGYAELLDDVTDRLVAAGRSADALPWIEKGLANSDSFNVPEHGTRLALRLARARFETGSPDAARAALRDFDRRVTARDSAEFAVDRRGLQARLLAQAGDASGSRTALSRAMAALRVRARTMDAGPQGYLALSAHEDLRDAMHALLAGDANAGYRFELEWRSLPLDLGRGKGRSIPMVATAPRPPPGAIHCVYRFADDGIVRWTATGSSVKRTVLKLSASDCRDAVRSLVDAFSSRRRPDAFNDRVHALAVALLPDEVLAPGPTPPRLLLISPDGALNQLPFEILAPAHEPLAARWNVVYCDRTVGAGTPLRTGPASVLADPPPTAALKRMLGGTNGLAEAQLEADSVARAWPGSRILRGEQATEHAVMAAWRDAPRIHVAAHLLRNPEIPFAAFFPLAVTPSAAPDESYLEMADIRSTDLRGCELVVLSACASGAPYQASGDRLGPSMGDAFLDAGAHAVIQTFWPIEDRDARRFVERFVATWKPGTDPIAALADTRRAAFRDGEPPWVWAAWSIHVAGIPTSSRSSARARVP